MKSNKSFFGSISTAAKKNPLAAANWIAVLFLSIASGVATYSGINSYIDNTLVAFLLMIGIQSILVISINKALTPGSPLFRASMVAAYVTTLGASVLFAISFYMKSPLNDAAAESARAGIHAVTVSIDDAAIRFSRAADLSTKIATHSRESFDREERVGGTCNDGSGKGRGVRWALRKSEAERSAAFAQMFDAARSDLDEILKRREALGGITTGAVAAFDARIAELREINASVSTVLTNAPIGELRAWAKSALTGPVECNDPTRLTLLGLAANLKQPTIGADPFASDKIIRPGRRAAVSVAFDMIVMAPLAWISGRGGSSITDDSGGEASGHAEEGQSAELQLDPVSIAIALIPDISIALLALAASGAVHTPSLGGLVSALREDPGLQDSPFMLLLMFLAHDDNGVIKLIVPRGGSLDRTYQALALKWFLFKAGALQCPEFYHIDRAASQSWFRRIYEELFDGGPDRFEVYSVNSAAVRELIFATDDQLQATA